MQTQRRKIIRAQLLVNVWRTDDAIFKTYQLPQLIFPTPTSPFHLSLKKNCLCSVCGTLLTPTTFHFSLHCARTHKGCPQYFLPLLEEGSTCPFCVWVASLGEIFAALGWCCTPGLLAWSSNRRICWRGKRWACRWGWYRMKCSRRPQSDPVWWQGRHPRSPQWRCWPGREQQRSKINQLSLTFSLLRDEDNSRLSNQKEV